MKPLAERNRLAVGGVGTLILIALVIAAFSYDKIPFVKGTTDYSAYFAEAGGIKVGSDVRVSGLGVGRVSDIRLEGTKVLVDFTVRDGVELGAQTEAAIKTETVLGTKFLEVTPRGDGNLDGTIPLERTTSPYDLPSALGDLTSTISALDTTQLSSALTTLADTFKDTPPDLKIALEGVARFSDTLNTRDAQLRNLLANANKVTAVLAKRSDQIAGLVVNTNALLAELLSQRSSVDALFNNLTAAAHQLSGLVDDNRTQLKPAVDKLNGVLGILDNRKKELQRTLYLLRRYAMSFGEVLGSGPFFKASLVNLAPGQFAQPFIDAAFSDLGLDPNVLATVAARRPADGAAGHPGTAGALPAHRARWRPESDSARRHYGQTRRSGMWSARLAAARPDRLLSVPRTPARAPARRASARSAHPVRATADADTRLRPGARRGAAAVRRARAASNGGQ